MKYSEWELAVPLQIRRDALWSVKAYRLTLFLSDLSWKDCEAIMKEPRLAGCVDQIERACAKISPCIAEGYSRGTGRDRARFYEYAIGSLREARDWYYKSRHVLKAAVYKHRLEVMEESLKLLLAMVARERKVTRKFDKVDA